MDPTCDCTKRIEDMETVKGSAHFLQLQRVVITHSAANDWMTARGEWVRVGRNTHIGNMCVCGYNPIVHNFYIENGRTGCQLYPIGSVCIEQFDNPELTKECRRLMNEDRRERRRLKKWDETVAPRGWFGGKKYKDMPAAYFKYLATLENPAPHLADMVAYYEARELLKN
jgi:hypothetical protein